MSNPLPPLPLTDDTLFLDNSALELISTCRRQAQYYIIHKREKNSERTALKFGGIIHKVLEVFYRNPNAPMEVRQGLMIEEATKQFADWTPPEGDYRNYDCAVGFIQKYCKEYPMEPFTIDVEKIELPFATPIGVFDFEGRKIKVVWTGRIDLLGNREGQLMYMDHKTTSMMGPTYFKEFDLSSQFKGYGWAIHEILGELPAFGVVNGLGIRKPTKTGTPFEFQRYTVRFTREDLEEWKSDTMHLIGSFLQDYFSGFMPRCTKWCVGKYGECQYYNVCVLPRDQRDIMLATGEYKDVTWSPLNND